MDILTSVPNAILYLSLLIVCCYWTIRKNRPYTILPEYPIAIALLLTGVLVGSVLFFLVVAPYQTLEVSNQTLMCF